MKKIAIFSSGSGSNAQKIIEHFLKKEEVEVSLIVSNRYDAYVLQRADNFEIPTHVLSREEFYESQQIVALLKSLNIDLIVLAGFLWLLPPYFIETFKGKIINIHPALLPKFGGKGMYGAKVHQSVLQANEEETGITIHYVNEAYDEGEIILQVPVKIDKEDTADIITFKVQQLEHLHYPKVIESLLKKMK